MILARKIVKIPEFFIIFVRKITKILDIYTIFAPQNARMLHSNCPKNIFARFFIGGGEARALPAPPPVSYAYGIGRSIG